MFSARIKNDGSGLEFGTDFTRRLFKDFLKKNAGARVRVELELPESRKMRGYLEGGILPLICYFQENMDYHNPDDIRKVRDWLKQEFNSEMVVVGGKVQTVPKSTKGRKELKAFLERVVDWLVENYAPPVEALNPENYKKYRDEIRPFENCPENFIDYLVETGVLRRGDKPN